MNKKFVGILAMGAMMASMSEMAMPSEFSNRPRTQRPKKVLSPKQQKLRKKNKAARKARRRNRK